MMFGLPSWAVRAIGIALLFAVVAGVGARLASIWYAPQLAGAKATIAAGKAQAKAVTAAQTVITKASAKGEEQAQKIIEEQTRVIIKKVPVYVSADPGRTVGCITYGMLRLHDAAIIGIDPADLPPPTAQPDAACSTVAPSDFMAAVAGNYAVARQNAEQLNALEADVQARIDAISSPSK